MSNLTVHSIKTLSKHELKLELTNRGLDRQGKKEDLQTKAISEISNDAGKHEFTIEIANISVELVKQ